MSKKIYIVSCGMGSADGITIRAKKIIDNADIVAGSKRLIAVFAKNLRNIELPARSKDAVELIKTLSDNNIAVLVSGDAGFYSLGLHFNEIEYDIEIVPGVSVVQASAAKLKTSWHDAKFLSLHANTVGIPKDIGKSIILTRAGLDMTSIMDKSWIDIYDIFIITDMDGVGEKIHKWDGGSFVIPLLTIIFLLPGGD